MIFAQIGRLVALPALALSALFVAGCGEPPRVRVTGKVTLGDKSVTSGTVAFVGGKVSAQGAIRADGSYEINGVPAGADVVVLVIQPQPDMLGGKLIKVKPPTNPALGIEKMGSPAAAEVTGPRVPTKYAKEASSGLKFTTTATPDPNVYDVKLAP